MRRAQWLMCLWPGLAELWRHGAWSGLALALGFSILLNLTLAASLVWTELVGPEARWAAWTALAALWVVGLAAGWHQVRADRAQATQGLFSQALSEYLQGNWYEAETLWRRVLKRDRRDAEAHLMLATLLRRTGRRDEARQLLARLSRLAGGEKWGLEIEREFGLLAEPGEAGGEIVEEPSKPAAGKRAA